jgi:ABC-type phosphate transport system substrate-binding protein
MKTRLSLRIIVLLLISFAAITAFAPFQNAGGVVIVHTSNPTGDISASQTKLLYTRKIKRLWSNNKPIKPAAYKGKTALQSGFYAKVLNMTAEEVEQYFKQRQFANSESLPAEVATEAEMIAYVSDNEGAIGFVSAAAAEAAKGKVKIICSF